MRSMPAGLTLYPPGRLFQFYGTFCAQFWAKIGLILGCDCPVIHGLKQKQGT